MFKRLFSLPFIVWAFSEYCEKFTEFRWELYLPIITVGLVSRNENQCSAVSLHLLVRIWKYVWFKQLLLTPGIFLYCWWIKVIFFFNKLRIKARRWRFVLSDMLMMCSQHSIAKLFTFSTSRGRGSTWFKWLAVNSLLIAFPLSASIRQYLDI